MPRGRSWRLVPYFLATCVLVAGACPPVRFGHAHPNHGEHSHHVGLAHDDGHRHADDLAVEEGSFHWHGGLLMPGGPLPVTGDPVEAGRHEGSLVGLAAPSPTPVLVPGPTLLAPPDFAWLPPPCSSASLLITAAHRPPCEPASPLVGCVLIRC